MSWAKWIIICWIAVCVPVGTVMAALMPWCVDGKPAAVSQASIDQHAHMAHMAHEAKAGTHSHDGKSKSHQAACEKCDLCSQAALDTPVLQLPPLPQAPQFNARLVALSPQHVPHPLYRPPLA